MKFNRQKNKLLTLYGLAHLLFFNETQKDYLRVIGNPIWNEDVPYTKKRSFP